MNIGTPITNRTLLLGAGFSKNWGGYLADEVNNLLLVDKEIMRYPRIEQLVRSNFNYENALAIARNGGYDPSEVKAFESAIIRVYQIQNSLLTNHFSQYYQVFESTMPLQNFFKMFSDRVWNRDSSAYCFSLNQDLLLESILVDGNTRMGYRLPGVTRHPTLPAPRNTDWYFSTRPPQPDDLSAKLTIHDTQSVVDTIMWTEANNIVKLHGSANWSNSQGDLLVIGGDKALFIDQSPLLTAYQQVFKDVLGIPDMRLLTIGYGFGDAHINDSIAAAIGTGLEIWVWGFGSRQQWVTHMQNPEIKHGKLIADKAKYENSSLQMVFRGNSAMQKSFTPVVDAFFA